MILMSTLSLTELRSKRARVAVIIESQADLGPAGISWVGVNMSPSSASLIESMVPLNRKAASQAALGRWKGTSTLRTEKVSTVPFFEYRGRGDLIAPASGSEMEIRFP